MPLRTVKMCSSKEQRHSVLVGISRVSRLIFRLGIWTHYSWLFNIPLLWSLQNLYLIYRPILREAGLYLWDLAARSKACLERWTSDIHNTVTANGQRGTHATCTLGSALPAGHRARTNQLWPAAVLLAVLRSSLSPLDLLHFPSVWKNQLSSQRQLASSSGKDLPLVNRNPFFHGVHLHGAQNYSFVPKLF